MKAFNRYDRAEIVSTDSKFLQEYGVIGKEAMIIGLPDELRFEDRGQIIQYRVQCRGLEFWTPWYTLKA